MAISPNDLKPVHKAARAAMSLYSAEYGPQRLGINDFYDQLSDNRKQRCRDLVKEIEAAPKERSG